jgi:hypothetical protein
VKGEVASISQADIWPPLTTILKAERLAVLVTPDPSTNGVLKKFSVNPAGALAAEAKL